MANCVYRKPLQRYGKPLLPLRPWSFGYGYVNLKDRPRQPVQRRGMISLPSTPNRQCRAQQIFCVVEESDRHWFSARQRGKQLCVRELVGEENFYTGIAHGEQEVCNWR